MVTNRLPDDWEDHSWNDDGEQCARCGWPLDDPVPEVTRAVALAHGGLAVQAVAVCRLCWEGQLHQERFLMAMSSPAALRGWEQMMDHMRRRVEEMDQEEREGEEWKGDWHGRGPG